VSNALQGNKEWLADRRGKFTGSKFKLLLNRGKGKDFTDQGFNYIRKVVAERMGSYEFEASSAACRWGIESEHLSIKAYGNQKNVAIEESGFIIHPDYNFTGCSVDGFVIGQKGIIEAKNPYNPANYIRYCTEEAYIIKEHGSQIYGNMWITKADYCDFIAYDKRNKAMPLYVKRFLRDEDKINKISERVNLAEDIAQEMYNDILKNDCEF
tara:strand:+ start:890 stop:1522 length:633 start_codon:yes stop_codon:yes gene_type:complete